MKTSSDSATYYEILNIDENASLEEIKKAYRRLAFQCHPDKVPENKKKWAHHAFIRVGTAYEILSDPEKRREYDEYIKTPEDEFVETPARETPAREYKEHRYKEPHYTEEELKRRFEELWETRGFEGDFDTSFKKIFDKDFVTFLKEGREGMRRTRDIEAKIKPLLNAIQKQYKRLWKKAQSFLASHLPAYSSSSKVKSCIDNALLIGLTAFCSRAFMAFFVPPLRIYYTGNFWVFLWGGKFFYLFGILIGLVIGVVMMYTELENSSTVFKCTGLFLLLAVAAVFLTRLIDIFVGNAFFRPVSPVLGWTALGLIGGALYGSARAEKPAKSRKKGSKKKGNTDKKDSIMVPGLITAGIVLFQILVR